MRRVLVLALGLGGFAATVIPGFSQGPPCTIGAAIPNYRVEAAANTFTSITGAPGVVNAFTSGVDDLTAAAIAFPGGFAFIYYGVAKTNFKICTKGWITFSTTTSASATNRHPGDGTVPNDAVFPWCSPNGRRS
jgi:hypothetical protein